MRDNHPVTSREHPFPPGKTLVSVTDLKGRITYCNEAFVEVSGYTRAELLGQPHNLIRHPDMPEEAFRDLWDTIQSGVPWTALVKNRRKNGDHYWVVAHATPMKDGEAITGYLSVRTPPRPDEVAAAQRLYALMRAQERDGRLTLRLHRGQLKRSDPIGRLRSLLSPGLRGRMLGIQALAAGLAVACAQLPGAWGLAATAAIAAVATAGVWSSCVRPVRAVLTDAHRLASGDLAHPLSTGAPGLAGELQQTLRQLSVNIRAVVLDTRSGVAALQAATREIVAGNLDLSARTENQSSSLEQTAASMEQINATVRQSADSAVRGATLAEGAGAVARRSHEAVQAVTDAMGDIARSSQHINDIVHVVEDVAFQTNILALNAAVEAARAGPAGRSFAIVAGEVRALAKRTADAVGQIRHLIQTSAECVSLGTTRSGDACQRVDEALQAVGNLSTLLAHISTSAVQQQSGIAEVNAAVNQLDSITQRNAAMVEELAASAQALRNQVESVSDSMRMFRLSPGEHTVAQDDAVTLRREGKAALARE